MSNVIQYILIPAILLLLHIKAYNQKPDFTFSILCPTVEFIGEIDGTELKITVELNQYHLEKIVGKYHFGNDGTPILLEGFHYRGREIIKLYEKNGSKTKKVKFDISYRNDKVVGNRITGMPSDTSPITFKEIIGSPHKDRCKYGYLLSYGENTIGTIELPYLRCADGPDSFKIIFEKTIGNQSYIIIDYTHKTNGCHSRGGSCGAGVESGLIWVAIDKTNCSITQSKTILYESCANSESCRTDQEINLMFKNNNVDFIKLRCFNSVRFFNKNRPELGFF